MTGVDVLILGLVAGFAGLYLSYRIIRALARWVLGTAAARSLAEQGRQAVQMQRKGSGKSLRVKLASVFAWQVSINEEKGTAGGSIKLNFPIRSVLSLGITCGPFWGSALEGQGYRQSIRSSVALVLQNPLPNLGLAVLVHGLGFMPLVFGPGALLANAVVAPLVVAIVAAAFIDVRVPVHDRPEVPRLPVPALATT